MAMSEAPRKRKRERILNLFKKSKPSATVATAEITSTQPDLVPSTELHDAHKRIADLECTVRELQAENSALKSGAATEEAATVSEESPAAPEEAPAEPPTTEPEPAEPAAVAPPTTTTPAPASPPPFLPDSAAKDMIVNCDPKDVFDVVTDFENYPQWVTGLKKVTVLEKFEDGIGKVVEFRAGTLGLSISYTLSYTLEPPGSVSWVSVAGGVKSIVGQYLISPAEGGGTRVEYRLDVDAGFGVPGPVRKAVTKLVIGSALPDLKRYLEKKYSK